MKNINPQQRGMYSNLKSNIPFQPRKRVQGQTSTSMLRKMHQLQIQTTSDENNKEEDLLQKALFSSLNSNQANRMSNDEEFENRRFDHKQNQLTSTESLNFTSQTPKHHYHNHHSHHQQQPHNVKSSNYITNPLSCSDQQTLLKGQYLLESAQITSIQSQNQNEQQQQQLHQQGSFAKPTIFQQRNQFYIEDNNNNKSNYIEQYKYPSTQREQQQQYHLDREIIPKSPINSSPDNNGQYHHHHIVSPAHAKNYPRQMMQNQNLQSSRGVNSDPPQRHLSPTIKSLKRKIAGNQQQKIKNRESQRIIISTQEQNSIRSSIQAMLKEEDGKKLLLSQSYNNLTQSKTELITQLKKLLLETIKQNKDLKNRVDQYQVRSKSDFNFSPRSRNSKNSSPIKKHKNQLSPSGSSIQKTPKHDQLSDEGGRSQLLTKNSRTRTQPPMFSSKVTPLRHTSHPPPLEQSRSELKIKTPSHHMTTNRVHQIQSMQVSPVYSRKNKSASTAPRQTRKLASAGSQSFTNLHQISQASLNGTNYNLMEDDLKRLKIQNKSLREQVSSTQMQNMRLSQKSSNLELELQEKAQAINKMQESFKIQEKQVEQLKSQLQTKQNEIDCLKAELAEVKTNFRSTNPKIQQEQDEKNSQQHAQSSNTFDPSVLQKQMQNILATNQFLANATLSQSMNPLSVGRNFNSQLSSPNIGTPQMGNSFSNSDLAQKIRQARIKGSLSNRDLSNMLYRNSVGSTVDEQLIALANNYAYVSKNLQRQVQNQKKIIKQMGDKNVHLDRREQMQEKEIQKMAIKIASLKNERDKLQHQIGEARVMIEKRDQRHKNLRIKALKKLKNKSNQSGNNNLQILFS